jgi:hypothetical protein
MGTAMLIVEQHVDVALGLAERYLVIKHGVVCCGGRVDGDERPRRDRQPTGALSANKRRKTATALPVGSTQSNGRIVSFP